MSGQDSDDGLDKTVVFHSGQTPGAGTRGGASQLKPGDVLNEVWRVGPLIGRGGMSEVFRGENLRSGEAVAIKVLLPYLSHDPVTKELLLGEARKMGKVRHPAIIHYVMIGESTQLGVEYIVMDLVEGPTLAQVTEAGPVAVSDLIAFAYRIADGLIAVHRAGVFLRDLSPDNVLVPGGHLNEAIVIDFGVARDTGAGVTTIVGDSFVGKLGFAAPEQFGAYDSDVGPWTDIYSLGLILAGAAVGKQIDMGVTIAEAVAKRRTPLDLSDQPEPLRPLLATMLAPNPADRFQTVEALLEALDQAWAAAGGTTPPRMRDSSLRLQEPSIPPQPRRAGRRAPWLIGGAVAALAVAAGVAGVAWWLGGQDASIKSSSTDGYTVAMSQAQGSGGVLTPVIKVTAPDGRTASVLGEAGASTAAMSFQFGRIDPQAEGMQLLVTDIAGGLHRLRVLELAPGGWRTIEVGSFRIAPAAAFPTDVDGDGTPDFVVNDERFSGTMLPPAIIDVVGGVATDVSAQPRYAPLFTAAYKNADPACDHHQVGACAVMVADATRLGQRDQAWRTMLVETRGQPHGMLTVCAQAAAPPGECPSGQTQAFSDHEQLEAFLVTAGYVDASAPPPPSDLVATPPTNAVPPPQPRPQPQPPPHPRPPPPPTPPPPLPTSPPPPPRPVNFGPDFDCTRVTTPDAILICHTPLLAQDDRAMASAYAAALARTANPDALRTDQRKWLAFRTHAAANVPSLHNLYMIRIHTLQTAWR